MNKVELSALLEYPDFEPEYPLTQIEELDGNILINSFVCLKVAKVTTGYKENEDIEINNEDNELLGYICNLELNKTISREILTEFRYYALLADGIQEDLLANNYLLRNKYVIIKENKYSEYKQEYLDSSILWGKFIHVIDETDNLPVKETINTVIARKNSSLPTDFHKDIAVRSLEEPYAFERFLKSYHLIELISDYYFVEKIKDLDDDLYGIGNLLSNYESNELNKLRIIFEQKITSLDGIITQMLLVKNFPDISKDIFQKYRKNGNILSDEEFDRLLTLPDFTEATIIREIKKFGNNKYRKCIIDLVSYWIYRIRCSIAHTKIGEYIFKTENEDYIVYFGQKIIDSIIAEVLKSDT